MTEPSEGADIKSASTQQDDDDIGRSDDPPMDACYVIDRLRERFGFR